MTETLQLGDVTVEVVFKDIKNVHLSVHPPTGRVRIAAPLRMTLESLRLFAIAKLAWIRQQQTAFRAQEREPPREYLARESHYLWGRRYLLEVREGDHAPLIEVTPRRLVLHVRPGTGEGKRQAMVESWYRAEVRKAVPELIARWEPRLGVTVYGIIVRRMRTKWGSCSLSRRTVILNTELAKKPAECLEYILVHEMAHLLEPTHNERFVAIMDRVMPRWRFYRQLLNRLPVRQEAWEC